MKLEFQDLMFVQQQLAKITIMSLSANMHENQKQSCEKKLR